MYVTLWCCLSLLAAGAEGAGEFPYRVRVRAPESAVRSGPGEGYYAAAILRRGDEVEVHRLDPGGWCAIRPPAGCVSWLPAADVEVQPDGHTGRVVRAGTPSLVAAAHGRLDGLAWQVRLREGELVEVLGERQEETEAGVAAWRQIAPPAGEFRWIRRADLDLPAEVGLAAGEYAAEEAEADPAAAPEGVRLTSGESPSTAAPGDGFTPRRPRADDDPATPRERLASREPRDGLPAAPSGAPASSAPDGALLPATASTTAELEALELQLSLLATQPPETWRLDPMRDRVAELAERGATPLDRGRARILLQRIEEFTSLAERRRNLGALADLAAAGDPTAAAALAEAVEPDSEPSASEAAAAATAGAVVGSGVRPAADSRFDGEGWLLPVHSKLPEAPSFALCDDSGRVLQYISPAPGVNLHRYLRQRVGLTGRRGYIPRLQTPHLMAEHVVRLER